MPGYLPHPRYALHPLLPERLNFRGALRMVNPAAASAIALADGYTLLSPRNRTTIYREAKRVLDSGAEGDFAEIGVHRGGSAAVLVPLLAGTGRHLHLFDRWGDLPEPTAEDGARREEYRRSNIPEKLAVLGDALESARHVVEQVAGMPSERVHYHQGWYDATLGDYRGGPLAFVSIDCDYYESVKLALAFLTRHAADRCTVILDDYRDWPGVKAATLEWLPTAPFRAALLPLQLGTAVLRLEHTRS